MITTGKLNKAFKKYESSVKTPEELLYDRVLEMFRSFDPIKDGLDAASYGHEEDYEYFKTEFEYTLTQNSRVSELKAHLTDDEPDYSYDDEKAFDFVLVRPRWFRFRGSHIRFVLSKGDNQCIVRFKDKTLMRHVRQAIKKSKECLMRDFATTNTVSTDKNYRRRRY